MLYDIQWKIALLKVVNLCHFDTDCFKSDAGGTIKGHSYHKINSIQVR